MAFDDAIIFRLARLRSLFILVVLGVRHEALIIDALVPIVDPWISESYCLDVEERVRRQSQGRPHFTPPLDIWKSFARRVFGKQISCRRRSVKWAAANRGISFLNEVDTLRRAVI